MDSEKRAYDAFVGEQQRRRKEIASLRATRGSHDYSQVRSREKQLARVETALEAPPPGAPRASINVRLHAARRATNGFAFEAAGLAKAYAQPLFAGLTIDVAQGERLAIVGPNGAGKSTLLRILGGDLEADAGTLRFNPAASVAYFAQNAHDQLAVDATAVENVLASAAIVPEEARALLGRMRISGDAADKPVRAFSGGERRRIMLARLMARKADVLLLDEPTNDLDIESREALEDVLDEYEGALVVVSHDRYLLARLAERVLWIENGAWGVLEGAYDAYEAQQRDRERLALESDEPRAKTSRLTPLKLRSQLETQINRIERQVGELDARKAEIETLFEDARLYEDRARVKALHDEMAAIGEKSAQAVSTWESLLDRLAELA